MVKMVTLQGKPRISKKQLSELQFNFQIESISKCLESISKSALFICIESIIKSLYRRNFMSFIFSLPTR